MKNTLFLISILIIIVLIGTGLYFAVSYYSGTNSPKDQNDKFESMDSKGKINDNTNTKSIPPLTNEDFVIKNKYNYIELGGEYEDLKTNEKVIMTVPANETHSYHIKEYDSFKIIIGSIIGTIDLKTNTIQTSRDISVGHTISEVIKKYGTPDIINTSDSNLPGQYVFRHEGKVMTFFIDKKEKVVLIRFELV